MKYLVVRGLPKPNPVVHFLRVYKVCRIRRIPCGIGAIDSALATDAETDVTCKGCLRNIKALKT